MDTYHKNMNTTGIINSSAQSERESFLYDSTNNCKPNETIMDYVISWTIRCAQEKYSNGDKRLFAYCKHIWGTERKV